MPRLAKAIPQHSEDDFRGFPSREEYEAALQEARELAFEHGILSDQKEYSSFIDQCLKDMLNADYPDHVSDTEPEDDEEDDEDDEDDEDEIISIPSPRASPPPPPRTEPICPRAPGKRERSPIPANRQVARRIEEDFEVPHPMPSPVEVVDYVVKYLHNAEHSVLNRHQWFRDSGFSRNLANVWGNLDHLNRARLVYCAIEYYRGH